MIRLFIIILLIAFWSCQTNNDQDSQSKSEVFRNESIVKLESYIHSKYHNSTIKPFAEVNMHCWGEDPNLGIVDFSVQTDKYKFFINFSKIYSKTYLVTFYTENEFPENTLLHAIADDLDYDTTGLKFNENVKLIYTIFDKNFLKRRNYSNPFTKGVLIHPKYGEILILYVNDIAGFVQFGEINKSLRQNIISSLSLKTQHNKK